MSAGGTTRWPVELRLKKAEKLIDVAFDDGTHFRLAAEYLRVESPSAEVQGHGPGQKTLVAGRAHVGIIGLEPVGNYGCASLSMICTIPGSIPGPTSISSASSTRSVGAPISTVSQRTGSAASPHGDRLLTSFASPTKCATTSTERDDQGQNPINQLIPIGESSVVRRADPSALPTRFCSASGRLAGSGRSSLAALSRAEKSIRSTVLVRVGALLRTIRCRLLSTPNPVVRSRWSGKAACCRQHTNKR